MTYSPTPAGTRGPSGDAGHRPRVRWPWFLGADVLLVIVFAGIGRASHGETAGAALVTAWPFLVGTALGWLVVTAWRRPAALWPTAVTVWLGTEAVGMALRSVTGQGTAWSFVLVSLIVLGIFLVGYRALVRLAQRTRHAH